MKYYLFIFILAGFLMEPIQSFAAAESSAQDSPQFQIDQGLVDRIYEKSTKSEGNLSSFRSGKISIRPEISYFVPSEMLLSNNYFDVPYKASFGNLPLFSILGVGPLVHIGDFSIDWNGGLAYTYKEGTLQVQSKTASANKERTTLLRLHYLPIFLGTAMGYQLVPQLKPFVAGRIGAQWLYQLANLDGIEQGFWVPFYEVGAGITLWDSSYQDPNAWFGGVTLSALTHTSFSSSQTVAGWNFNVGINLKL